ncbi:penicillin-binding protein 2 [Candidatus Parcubacteria bacterium]|nr:penicillin-binding protein 2 [Candidatus Parcubacteria bacterium]
MKNWRINLILAFILLFGAVIIGRLFYIQIVDHNYYLALAKGQHKFLEEISGRRGEVFFQNKTETLAINKNQELIFISPKEIENQEETADKLAEILGLEKDVILEKTKKDTFYELIKNKLSPEEIEDLKKINLTGVHLRQVPGRYYTQGLLAAHIIGFLGGDKQGQYGIEGYHNDLLKGEQGLREKEKSPWGFSFFQENSAPALKGTDIVLTIDYNIQFKAEKLLKQAKENLDIESGTIIVIEPDTGKILTMANFPSFNPNEYSKIEDFEIFQNSAIQKLYEPGSVMKPFTMAAALNEGKITPETTYIDEGKLTIKDRTIYNYNLSVWGEMTMTNVLEKSINTGAVFAESQVGHNIFLDYLEKFGFFNSTDIDLQGESYSQNKELKKGYEINFATASYGQGIEMTPIQLARAFSSIANGGKIIKPYIVENENQPQILNRPISKKTSSQLTAMLVSVTENGFAKKARVPGYYIAGKTGTAQVSWSALDVDKEGYSDKTIQSFIGFAPAFDPQFLILVKLDNPKTRTAEYSAMPCFQKLAKYIIDYWQIPPDLENY